MNSLGEKRIPTIMNRPLEQKNNRAESVRIAFGSCNNQNLTNNLWGRIAERDPIAFVWAGDAIYAGELFTQTLVG